MPTPASYEPLATASRPWRVCASYPHLKDAYWLSVNYGMVQEAERLGVRLSVVEAGGYPNVERQRQQILDCVAAGAEVLILGSVSYAGLSDTVEEIARTVPVVAAVNDIDPRGIAAKAGVSWTEMGRAIGAYFIRAAFENDLIEPIAKGHPGAACSLLCCFTRFRFDALDAPGDPRSHRITMPVSDSTLYRDGDSV